MAVQPKFPGGYEVAPEITAAGGCGNPACSCSVERGRTFCCQACGRARGDEAACRCGHFGCTSWP